MEATGVPAEAKTEKREEIQGVGKKQQLLGGRTYVSYDHQVEKKKNMAAETARKGWDGGGVLRQGAVEITLHWARGG